MSSPAFQVGAFQVDSFQQQQLLVVFVHVGGVSFVVAVSFGFNSGVLQ